MGQSNTRKPYGFRTYLRLSAGVFIITVFYYVFNKLLDMAYGKFDVGTISGIFILVLIFILGFAVYLRIFDRKDTLARMLGGGGEEKT